MRIVDRYLLRGFVGPFLFCLSLFCVLFVIVDSFNNIDEFLRYHVSVKLILTYYAYLLPTLLVQIVPIAALVSILFILGDLNKHNELIAMRASGLSALHILAPFIFFSVVISFTVLLINEAVVPDAAITSKAIYEGLIQKGKYSLNERAIKNVTLLGRDHRLYYAREFEVTKQVLYDVSLIQDNAEREIESKITASRATYADGAWTFEDAIQFELDAEGDVIGEPHIAKKLVMRLDERPEDFIKQASQVEYMNTRQLRVMIKKLKGSGENLLRGLKVDLHTKIAFPFITLIVMLIGAPLAMRTGRGNAMVGIGTSVCVVIAYYGMHSICVALGKGGQLPPVLSAWFANLAFTAIGVYLIRRTA